MKNRSKNTEETRVKQGPDEMRSDAYKIGASTPYDFEAQQLTAYGGLLPVAVMLEKLRFTELLEETLHQPKRRTRVMSMAQFITALVLAFYVGFSRLAHLRFLEREPMLTGIVRTPRLPPQCTFWRFLASLHLEFARQLGKVQARLRQRVWDAANIRLTEVTLDTDTTVHTIYGQQMGGRKGYNPKNKGKLSYQPILTFLAETREFAGGELRNGDRPDGKQIARHLHEVIAALPSGVKTVRARADSGFYCWEAIEAYEQHDCHFIVSARKTSRLVDELKAATWTGSPRTDADGQCQFRYQPTGWPRAYRFFALRYEKTPAPAPPSGPEQYQSVRHAGVQLSSVRHQYRWPHRCPGVVLQSAGRRREPHQGSQQRCRSDGPPLRALGTQLRALPTGDAGLQSQLLAHPVQSRAASQAGANPAHDIGYHPAPVPLPGS